jgi:histidyl-tRNA synthetase
MLYTSPEQESGGSYHHSADMFSLGIVFFEMWCPFDSMMGRAKSLQALRDTNTVPEKSFPEDDPLGEKVKKITEYLIARDPASRPSAEQLLQSPFVPVSLDMDQGYLRAALQAVRDPDSGFFQTLLRRVFNKWVPEHLDYIFDASQLSTWTAPNHNRDKQNEIRKDTRAALTLLERLMVGVFRNHGALHVPTPMLTPHIKKMMLDYGRGEGGHHNNNAIGPMFVLDPKGTLLQLPRNLTLAFARDVARKRICYARRFDINVTFESQGVGKRPREARNGSFDIVWSSAYTAEGKQIKNSEQVFRNSVHLAEVISVSDEIAGQLFGGTCKVRVNHTQLLKAIIDLCKIQSRAAGEAVPVVDEEEEEDDYDDEEDDLKNIQKKRAGRDRLDTEQLLLLIYRNKDDYRKLKSELIELCDNNSTSTSTSTTPYDQSATEAHFDFVHLLMTFLELHGPIEAKLEQMKQMTITLVRNTPSASNQTSQYVLNSVRELEGLLEAIKTMDFSVTADDQRVEGRCHVMLDVGYVPPDKTYTGLVYQLVTPVGGKDIVLAAGGCYDHLLSIFQLPSQLQPHGLGASAADNTNTGGADHAAGCMLYLKAMLSALRWRAQQQTKNPGVLLREILAQTTTGSAEAVGRRMFLFANRDRMIRHRVAAASRMWRRGMHAEYCSSPGVTLNQVQNHLLLIIPPSLSS